MSPALELRAPREDGGVLAVPSLSAVPALLADNRARLAASCAILGRPLAELQRVARQAVLHEASAYLAEGNEPVPPIRSDRLIVAGHQPELFHAGVWVKNFALRALADAHGLVPINLVVDNDTAKATVLRIPPAVGEANSVPPSTARPAPLTIPYDHWKADVPYEERHVLDEALFASLPERVGPHFADWTWRPLLADFWSDVLEQAKRTSLLGERLAGARRSLERRWHCHNFEVPISRLCRTEAFAWLAAHIVTEPARFHGLYNEIVQDYRRRHGIRSRNHPVPDLAATGDWLELPFWAWRADRSRRERLMVRRTQRGHELWAGRQSWGELPSRARDTQELIRTWRKLETQGLKIRTRAITTTLFARLFLADLFIHGIGGAKYDELTDELIRRFYGLEPPHFLVLSATLLLPFARDPVTAEDCRRLAHAQRDVRWNPQRHLAEDSADARAHELATEKQAWIDRSCADAAQRRLRFQRLRDITDKLRTYLAERERDLEADLRQGRTKLVANTVRSGRDFAFCLHPEDRLQAFCRQFLSA